MESSSSMSPSPTRGHGTRMQAPEFKFVNITVTADGLKNPLTNRKPCANCSASQEKCMIDDPYVAGHCKKCFKDGLTNCPPYMKRKDAIAWQKEFRANRNRDASVQQLPLPNRAYVEEDSMLSSMPISMHQGPPCATNEGSPNMQHPGPGNYHLLPHHCSRPQTYQHPPPYDVPRGFSAEHQYISVTNDCFFWGPHYLQ